MASTDRFYMPYQTGFDTAGAAGPGAKMYFYTTGTSTPKDTYSDSALATPNANPVVADAAGRFGSIFLGSGDYKVVLKDSNDVQIWSADPVAKFGNSAASTTVAGTIEIATVAEALLGTSTTLAIVPDTLAEAIQQGFMFGTVGGTANAITITPSVVPTALATGMKCIGKATASNTSTTTLNYAGLGVVAVKVAGPSGATACAGGEIVSGNTYEFEYSASDSCWYVSGVGEALGSIQSLTEDTNPDWSADWVPSFDISAKLLKKWKLNTLVASQATMEANSSLVSMATPGNMKWHPGVAKAGGSFSFSGSTQTNQNTYGLTSATDAGVGLITFTLSTAFSTAYYNTSGICQRVNTNDALWPAIRNAASHTPTTTSLTTATVSDGAATSDPTLTQIMFHGDQ